MNFSAGKRVIVWAPHSISRSIGAGNDDHIAVGVSHPALPVIRSAIALRRVSVSRQDDFHIHFGGALHHGVKVVDLEPQQHPVSIRPVMTISNRSMMVLDFEAVQLKNKLAIEDQLLICGPPMIAAAA